ncbi:Leucine rich repeat-containing protein [Sarcina sp. DSM 11001]|uniref:leucine-rich repeat protein n=1 Tax=Sarcina sp. DSM 11001 TaxID=1798184 RepID=UPI00088501A4|nr:leucine-rich repeat protein [Sarcina sp. DSM 11001]SDL27023.1 Leucine rich repeat-containing protein [Sarcina sp. DSM 11001]
MKRNSPTLAMLLAATLAFTTVCPAFAAEGSVEAGNAQTASAATEELVTYEMAEEPDGVGMDADPDQDVVSEANNDESGNTEEVDSTVVQETEEDAALDETVEDEEITDSAEEAEMDLVQEADQKDDETGEEAAIPTEEMESAEKMEAVTETEAEAASDMTESDNTETVVEKEEEGSLTDFDIQDAEDVRDDAIESQDAADEALDLAETEAPSEEETVSEDAVMDGMSSGTLGDNLTWTLDGEGVLTISGTGRMYFYEEFAPWYSFSSSVKAIQIEEGVTSIPHNAFEYCNQVNDVTIPESMMKIDFCAFSYCNNLTNVYYAGSKGQWNQIDINGNNYELLNAAIQCAKEDIYVTGIALDHTSASMVETWFSGDSLQLTATITPSDATVKSIIWTSSDDSVATVDKDGKVEGQKAGTATITATAADGSGATATCTVTVLLPSGTCGDNLTWTLDGEGILTISGTGKMYDYTGENMPWCSFNSSVKAIHIEEGVTSIGKNAFYWCRQLEDVTIPESMTKIGEYAFDGCAGLTNVYFAGSEGQWNRIDIGKSNSRLLNANIQYAKEDIHVTGIALDHTSVNMVEKWFSGDSLQLTATITPSDATVKSIIWTSSNDSVASVSENGWVQGKSAGNATITATAADGSGVTATCTVTVLVASGTCGDNLTWTFDKDQVLTISGTGEMISSPWLSAESAWGSYIYKDITTVVIEDGVTNIRNNAFKGLYNLTGITIPNSVTDIGNTAFERCSSLSDITIPYSVTCIGESAFSECSSLTSISIPVGVTSIGGSAFSGCTSLVSISIPEGVTSVGDYTFSECSSLAGISIPEGVTSVGDYTFSECSSLASVSIPESVTSIGKYAFYGCSSLAGISIPVGVTSIGDDAFTNCRSLAEIEADPNNSTYSSLNGALLDKDQETFICCPEGKTGSYPIPDGVTVIKNYAFRNCGSLESITIPEGVRRIEYGTFSGCNSLSDITIPGSVTVIVGSAFNGCNSLTDVYYPGPKRKWDQIDIYDDNDPLVNAAIHTYIDVSEISLDKTSAILIKNNTLQLTATVSPENAMNKSVSWTSDSWTATVDDKGLVKAVGEGTATITATAADGSGVTATCTVTVFEDNNLQAYAEGTRDSRTNVDIQAGKPAELRVTVSAVDESELSFQWYDPEGKAIEGATDLSYTAAAVNGNYRCEVRDQYGSRRVVEFYVQVDNNLQAYVEGKDISEADLLLAPGETSELRVTVSANDESDLSCQWYDEQDRAIEGATGTSYTIEPVTRQTQYEFRVSDRYGNIAYARFYVQIENHLRAYADGTEDTEAYRYVTSGESAKLQVNVSADDKDHLRYQWFKIIPDAWGKLEYYTINGATGASYTVNSVTGFTRYYCRVQDQYSNRAEVRFYTCIAGFDSAQTISCGDAVSASANSEAGGGAYPVYRFIPAQTAKYVMYSTDGVDDPYLEILNDSHDSFVRTASPFEDPAVEYDGKGHFRVEQVLEKGKTYYLVVGSYSHSASCVLHLEKVNAAVTGIKLNKTSANLNITKTLQLTATVLPDDATDKSVNWSSSNRKAATVDSNGKVRGVGAGTATITAAAADGSGVTATCTVTVSKLSVANVTVSGLTAKTYTGKALTQTPTVKLGSTTLKLNTDYKLSYTNNTNAGTATLTVTGIGNYTGTKKATFTINKAAQKITAKASAASVAVGKTVTISVTGAKGKKSYKSSNTAIATVTTAGSVAAKKVGTVKITATSAATANFKAASKTVTINVVPAATASLKAENQPTGIKLTWKKVTGANGYKVYRGSTLVKNITSGSTVTYTDTKANTNGTKYTFKIVAKASTGDSTLSKSVITYRVARPAISSAANSAAGKMTVKWAKNAKANGYQLQYSTSKTFASGKKNVNVAGAATVSKAISSLAKGKTYYVRLRTYKTVGSTKHWSAWSATKTVKINK